MKYLSLAIVVFVSLAFVNDVPAQTGWSWEKPNWFAKEQTQEAEPVEPTEEPTIPDPPNPFAGVDLRPRPIEWQTPAFLRRMNENSARMWRTTRRNFGHWASSTSAAIRNSTYNTWDAITGATSRAQPAEVEQPSPNFGGVHEFLAKPKLKF